MRGERFFKLDQTTKKNRKGQVWVETVIYTLIALVVIGIFVSFAKPKIEEIQDKAIIEQSVGMLEDLNDITLSLTQGGSGNQRIIDIGIKKGQLTLDGINDKIIFELEGRYSYTEPGQNGQPGSPVNIGNIIATTQKKGDRYTVTLTSDYSNYNITYNNIDNFKTLFKAPSPYKITIANRGEIGGVTVIDFKI
ncbi:MAG: hypothetical protein AABW50_04635 [Nanoarchaeota archaeon]